MGATKAERPAKTAIHLRVDAAQLARIDQVARRTNLSRAEVIRTLIEAGLEDADDLALALEAKRRLEDPNEEWIPWEEVKQGLGL